MEKEKEEYKWDEIVFENRNREYGAYVLRSNYSRNVSRAGGLMGIILGLSLTAPALAGLFADGHLPPPREKKILVDVGPPPIVEEKPHEFIKPPPPPERTLRYVAPRPSEEADDEEIPTIEQVHLAAVSTGTTEGDSIIFNEPVTAVVETPGEDNTVHNYVEVAPQYPGGLSAMADFIRHNLKYPKKARQMGTEGKVFVQFVVNKDGSIVDVQTLRGISAECDAEANRVISLMPAWSAGKQNGKAVRVKYVLPVYYMMPE